MSSRNYATPLMTASLPKQHMSESNENIEQSLYKLSFNWQEVYSEYLPEYSWKYQQLRHVQYSGWQHSETFTYLYSGARHNTNFM